ncbi:3919_t:CDS:2 [Paraglomus brasilianum]|uniref:3919_t:CDS:1 n=1 Tax=Paraglomus brasilianum TaxID=144538 RepID=A0A9N9D5D6_9GLOM|nr:3919_t:CDS:2 [Paraglomus brasilianum]
MNLPATAIEFLGKEALITNPDDQLPMIHCQCFSKSEEPEKDLVKRVVTALGYPLQPGYKIHFAKRKIDGSNVAVQNDEYDDNKVKGIAKKVKVDIE